MPDFLTDLNNSLEFLGLISNAEFSKKELVTAYRKKALSCHPDREGGTNDQFVTLTEAFDKVNSWLVSQAINTPVSHPEYLGEEYERVFEIVLACSKLYILISDVEKTLNAHCNSKNIAQQQLHSIMHGIQAILKEITKEKIVEESKSTAINKLESYATNIDKLINNIHKGPQPVFAGMLAGSFMAILLGILVLMIALSLPHWGVVCGTAVLGGLIATPPAGGLLFGTFCFFGATSADKKRTEQQQEMNKIVNAIRDVADVVNNDADNCPNFNLTFVSYPHHG